MEKTERIVKLFHENNQFILDIPSERVFKMLAMTETKFYVNGEFVKLGLHLSNGKVSGCELNRFGSKNIYEKAN